MIFVVVRTHPLIFLGTSFVIHAFYDDAPAGQVARRSLELEGSGGGGWRQVHHRISRAAAAFTTSNGFLPSLAAMLDPGVFLRRGFIFMFSLRFSVDLFFAESYDLFVFFFLFY